MDQMQPKVTQWIKDGKDPRSARWQAAIETVLDLFLPAMEKGRLTPVCALEDADMAVFASALKHIDLSPNIWAAFLPPSVADPILPPESVEELMRIDKSKPSCKIIIMRPGKDSRLLCAEISDQATRPGVDIFEAGAFLGNFDYPSQDICIPELGKAVRAHGWEKDKWQTKDHLNYTVNWFERISFLETTEVTVDESRSVFHSPTLLKTDKIDALFQVTHATLTHRLLAGIGGMAPINDPRERQTIAETWLLDLLGTVKNLELLDFRSFTNAQNHTFQKEFARTARKLADSLGSATAA